MSRVWCLVVGLVLVDADILNPFLDSAKRKESINRLESCFCEVIVAEYSNVCGVESTMLYVHSSYDVLNMCSVNWISYLKCTWYSPCIWCSVGSLA